MGALRAGRGYERARWLSTLGWIMILLLFATSVDVVVPLPPMQELFAAVSGDDHDA